MLILFVIGGILAVSLAGAFYVLVTVGAERFVRWLGPLVARILVGLFGLAVFGVGSIALFRVFTGRAEPVPSKPRAIVASLFFALLGLLFIVGALQSWDTRAF